MNRRNFLKNTAVLSLIPFIPKSKRVSRHFTVNGTELVRDGMVIDEIGYNANGTWVKRKIRNPRICHAGDTLTITYKLEFHPVEEGK